MQKRSRLPSTYVSLAPEDTALPIRWGRAHQGDAPITSLHRHEVLELGWCYEGTGVFVIDGKVMPFRAGCATAINPLENHLARSAPGTSSRWMWILFEPRLLITDPAADPSTLETETLCGPRFPNVLDPQRHPSLCALVRVLAEELDAARPRRADAVRGIAWAILAALHRLPTGSRPRFTERRGATMRRIAAALDLIAGEFAHPLDVARLAAACRTSAPTLRRLFQHATGLSPKRYLLRYRAQQAAAALRAKLDRPVADIAFSCGFESLSAFNRHFRRELGASPREWRKRTLSPA